MPLKQSWPKNNPEPFVPSSGLANPALQYPFDSIREGQKFEIKFQITEKIYTGFLTTFDDRNPLHVDDAYAQAQGFTGKVMHGAILNGFISALIGMQFPGKESMIHSVNVEYKKPNFLNDELLFAVTVVQRVEAVRTLVLKLNIFNRTRDYLAATARVQVGLL